jgi:hemolysin D
VSVSPDSAPPEQGGSKPSATTELPSYKGIVELKAQFLEGGMGRFAVAAGMQVTAEIVEGDRTVMEYLLSPVRRVANEAGRER